ncbi:MAG TPA: aminotransferase class I/II-fold pyridoxal phosphate-dependent enzyme, partial [Anaerolineae bacterium]|nr:aminotransferase class I/II-fold pyridoxal phosphate-dependent enzyme [Anaerolineae bacterium]
MAGGPGRGQRRGGGGPIPDQDQHRFGHLSAHPGCGGPGPQRRPILAPGAERDLPPAAGPDPGRLARGGPPGRETKGQPLHLGRNARRAKILWLNYPNNPTGATATLDFFAEAVAFARRYDLLICHDNPYCDITFDGYTAPSLLQVAGAMEVAIEFNSLSKVYNMA